MSSSVGSRGDALTVGPSRTPPRSVEVPSFGLEYFEYRRRLFLAGQPIPPLPKKLPATYTVPMPLPEPVPPLPRASAPNSAVGRLESLLSVDGDVQDDIAWKAGIATVHRCLTEKRKLARPLRLGLVILRAGWLRDGTWPIDPKTKRPLNPPDSPFMVPNEAVPESVSPRRSDNQPMDEEDWVEDDMVGEDDLRIGDQVWRGAATDIHTADHG